MASDNRTVSRIQQPELKFAGGMDSLMRCVWCWKEAESLTRDHVVPRAIGGTLDYAVPSCDGCQVILSKAEAILARKSMLAIHALASDLRPRHPKRPESGILQVSCLLVKNPLGGYGESVLRVGEKVESLCHCEIKVAPGEPIEGRTRGESREQTDLLFAKFKNALSNAPEPNGLVCEINVSLDVPPEISADPDFWPRIVMLPNGNLLLRARDPQEAERFMAVFAPLVMHGVDAFRGTWQTAEISGGTQHQIVLEYDSQAVRRVAAKIAYGLFLFVSGEELDQPRDGELRAYIRGFEDKKPEPVTEAPESFVPTTGGTPYHEVILGPPHDLEAAIVRLYGYGFRVDLGSAVRRLSHPVVVLCATDGSGMRLADPEEANQALAASESLVFREP
jgi:hypothetical protein